MESINNSALKEKIINKKKSNLSINFEKEIDYVLSNNYKTHNQVKARDFTPGILVNNGIDDLPMLMTAKHIKSTIWTKKEAIINNDYSKNINYHGLGKQTLLKVVDSLDDPLYIYKISNDNYLIITELKDKENRNIVVPVKINGKGTYNNVYIMQNQIKSAYGKNNLYSYIQNNQFKKIYEKRNYFK